MQSVDILVILDRSGSMISIKDDVIGGFNQFLKDQQAQEGVTHLTLVQFDSEYEVVHNRVPVKNVPALTTNTYIPRGSTALLDAVNKAIATESETIVRMAATDRPENVVCLIITDGQENASREVTRDAVKKLIEEKEKGPWVFSFLGTKDANAFHEAAALGIRTANVASIDATKLGVAAAYQSHSHMLNSVRNAGTSARKSEDAVTMQAVYDEAAGNTAAQ